MEIEVQCYDCGNRFKVNTPQGKLSYRRYCDSCRGKRAGGRPRKLEGAKGAQ